MSEHQYRQAEERRVEGTATRRYQHGGRRGRQREQQAGQPTHRMGGQSSPQMGQQMGGPQTGGQPGSQMGGQPSPQTSGQPAPQMGNQPSPQMSGQPAPQMGGSQMPQGTEQMRGRQSQQGLVRSVTASDIAATDVVTTTPDAPVTEVSQKMAREDVGSVVVTEGSRPTGIITDRKIALATAETPDVSQLRAADLMSAELFTVTQGTNVFDLVQKLSAWGIRRVPVVDDQENLRGIVSLDDAIVLLSEEFHNVGQIIRKQSPRL